MKVLNYSFQGPFTAEKQLVNRAGIYIIADLYQNKYLPIDVGESGALRSRIESHDRAHEWNRHKRGKLVAFVLYTPHLNQISRIKIEKQIRESFDFPCGKR
jgi:hypothetical protein